MRCEHVMTCKFRCLRGCSTRKIFNEGIQTPGCADGDGIHVQATSMSGGHAQNLNVNIPGDIRCLFFVVRFRCLDKEIARK